MGFEVRRCWLPISATSMSTLKAWSTDTAYITSFTHSYQPQHFTEIIFLMFPRDFKVVKSNAFFHFSSSSLTLNYPEDYLLLIQFSPLLASYDNFSLVFQPPGLQNLSSPPGIKPWPQQWKPWVPTIGPDWGLPAPRPAPQKQSPEPRSPQKLTEPFVTTAKSSW